MGPFVRDKQTNKVKKGQWSDPIFDYLQNAKFIFTEKLDGTNIRLIYQPEQEYHSESGQPLKARVSIKGRSDGAQVNGHLVDWCKTLDVEKFVTVFGHRAVCIYGEGVGSGIRKGGLHYGPTHFRAFAIKGPHGFYRADIADDILRKGLGLQVAPVVLEATLNEGIEYMKTGFRTQLGPNPNTFQAEGLVGVPTVPICKPNGERIIVKLKHCDLALEPIDPPDSGNYCCCDQPKKDVI
jgi:hypothetical protein